MINEKIENFLEKVDMNYLFCLLSNLEARRLNQFPVYVRHKFPDKITLMSMEHVAKNEVPDYITELAEAELEAQKDASPFSDEEIGEYTEETVDDSERFIEEIESDNLDSYDDDDEDEDFFGETEEAEEDDDL